MAELVEILNKNSKVTITLDGNKGEIIIRDAAGNEILCLGEEKTHLPSHHIGAPPQEISLGSFFVLKNTDGKVRLSARNNGQIRLGGNGAPGDFQLFQSADDSQAALIGPSIRLDGQEASLCMGGNQANGDIALRDTNGRNRIHLDAGLADIHLGGAGRSGNFSIHHLLDDKQSAESTTIHLDGEGGVVTAGGNGAWGAAIVRGLDNKDRIRLVSAESCIHLGGNGAYGNLFIYPSQGDNYARAQATIHLNGQDGDIVLHGTDGRDRIRLDPGLADIHLGGNDCHGNLMIYPRTGDNKTLAQTTIHLNGEQGDIILRNGDCAEDFDVPDGEEIEPGTVVVIENEGRLRRSAQAYDRKVAGVISGAGDSRPGIVLDRQLARNARLPVALTGKVYCKVDSEYSPIEVGDLLTTSPTPGYAMKAADPLRAFGAVIGKALRRLDEGRGLIPILVALQ